MLLLTFVIKWFLYTDMFLWTKPAFFNLGKKSIRKYPDGNKFIFKFAKLPSFWKCCKEFVKVSDLF